MFNYKWTSGYEQKGEDWYFQCNLQPGSMKGLLELIKEAKKESGENFTLNEFISKLNGISPPNSPDFILKLKPLKMNFNRGNDDIIDLNDIPRGDDMDEKIDGLIKLTGTLLELSKFLRRSLDMIMHQGCGYVEADEEYVNWFGNDFMEGNC